MRNFLFIPIFILASCSARIGDLTMVSTRNVDSKTNYVELKRNVKGKSRDLETAIDKAVKQVSSGEFMKNVVITQNTFTGRIKVVGDVWGMEESVTIK